MGLKRLMPADTQSKQLNRVLKILEGAEANAENKGLDTERLKIIHASAYPGMKIKRYTPRAFGRATPKFETLCHIELALEEQPETAAEEA
jgi:large subunit ribosomal protein L22